MQGRQSKHLKTENQANLWNDFKSLVLSYVYKTTLFRFGAFQMKTDQLRDFLGKQLLPLLAILQWKKPCSKIFYCINIVIVNRFSNFLWHFLRLGMQNGDMLIFFLEVFQKSEILKNAVSGRWCLDSSVHSNKENYLSQSGAIKFIRDLNTCADCTSRKHVRAKYTPQTPLLCS